MVLEGKLICHRPSLYYLDKSALSSSTGSVMFPAFLSSAVFSFNIKERILSGIPPGTSSRRRLVGPDLGPNCLHRLSADDTSSLRAKSYLVSKGCNNTKNFVCFEFTHSQVHLYGRIQRGTGGPDPPPSLINSKNIGSLSYTGPDPPNHIATRPAFNFGPLSAQFADLEEGGGFRGQGVQTPP